MTIETILKSPDLYILFDGCPTCGRENSGFLNSSRIYAQQEQRQLHVIPSGSPTATLIRTIAQNQGQRIEYPMILMDGTIRYDPQDIIERNEK